MKIAYKTHSGVVVTASGPCGMRMTKHSATTMIFEDAFDKCDVIITIASISALETRVVIMRVYIVDGMELHTINVQHSPRISVNPIEEICDKINEVIAAF